MARKGPQTISPEKHKHCILIKCTIILSMRMVSESIFSVPLATLDVLYEYEHKNLVFAKNMLN